jgi:uncharacterized membrane protein (UPF0127 family)
MVISAAIATVVLTPALLSQEKQEEKKERKWRHVPQRQFQLKDLQVVKLKLNKKHEYTCWVMDREAKRQEGMMFLESSDWKKNEGMIFAFKRAQPLSFWMKNTYVPLDIAYLDGNGKILNMYTMQPLDVTTNFYSKGYAKYAVELKAGTFKKLKIKAGMRFEIPKTVKPKN